jgi:hypothetical protein
MVEYTVQFEDSVFTFDSNLQFKKDAIFRAQRVSMTLYVPYNHPFVLDDNIYRLLSLYTDYDKRNGNTWIVTKDKYLTCTSCPEEIVRNEDGSFVKSHSDLSDYNELEITGLFDITITQGHEHSLELIGSESEKRKYKINQHGQTLVIEYNNNKSFDWKDNPLNLDKIRIKITMPELESLELKGAGDVTLRDFTSDRLDIEAMGALDIKGQLNVQDLTIQLDGASKLELRGTGSNLDATVQGASQLRAYDFTTENVIVEANGVSSAKVYATNRIELREGVASKISYRGNPAEVIKE